MIDWRIPILILLAIVAVNLLAGALYSFLNML
jgi:hypothetical protein